jgi:peptidoglycan/xylan/chitin deacetylase (PgdA/CDA1 family)
VTEERRSAVFRTLVSIVAVLATAGSVSHATAATEDPLSVVIVSPPDGAVLSGQVTLQAQTTGDVVAVTFDWSDDDGLTWRPIGEGTRSGTWSRTWDTTGLDGPALLRATASDGTVADSTQTGVTVDNLPPDIDVSVSPGAFSPNGDGRKDRAVIQVSVSEAADLQIRVRVPGGPVIREWNGHTTGPGGIRTEWRGQVNGSRVPDGRYSVEAVASDVAALVGNSVTSVVVDTRAPVVRWLEISPDPLVRQKRVGFSFRARDRSPALAVRLQLIDAAGRRVARIRRVVAPGIRQVAWDPSRAPFPGGYRAVLSVSDDAGNASRPRQRNMRVHRPTRARVFTRLPEAGRRVALTFDDCHFRSAWSRILNVLRRTRVKATFFCPGRMVQWNADLARRTVRQGHTPAAHGWDHAYLGGRGVDATAWRVRADARAWWDVTGTTSAPYFRPPFGAYDRAVIAGAGQAFHPRVMLWDVDTKDWMRPGSSAITARVVRSSRPGSVVLMHTLDQTASALPSIIRGLRRRGLVPVSLPKLFRAAGLR